MESFFNIVSTKKIRLSNAFKTNDFMEVTWILELLDDEKYNDLSAIVNIEQLKNLYEDWIKTYIKPHIACFSTNGDTLSQWRGYANDGKGVAIGFNRIYFEWISQNENKEIVVKNVVYDRTTQRRLLRQLIDEEKLIDFFQLNKDMNIHDIVFIPILAKHGIIFKHHSFAEEGEVRIIHGNDELAAESDSLLYRPTEDNLISYLEIKLDLNFVIKPIGEIILGPKCKAEESDVLDFVQGFFGVDSGINVYRSECSYR